MSRSITADPLPHPFSSLITVFEFDSTKLRYRPPCETILCVRVWAWGRGAYIITIVSPFVTKAIKCRRISFTARVIFAKTQFIYYLIQKVKSRLGIKKLKRIVFILFLHLQKFYIYIST